MTYAELSVLYYFAMGKSNTEVAEMTGRSKSTISTDTALSNGWTRQI